MELPQSRCQLSFKPMLVSVLLGIGLWCVHLSAAPFAAAVHKVSLSMESGSSSQQKTGSRKPTSSSRSPQATTIGLLVAARVHHSLQSSSVCLVQTTLLTGRAVRRFMFVRMRSRWLGELRHPNGRRRRGPAYVMPEHVRLQLVPHIGEIVCMLPGGQMGPLEGNQWK